MATKVLRQRCGKMLPVIGITIIVMLSCDTRNEIKPNQPEANVGSVLIVLNPNQIHLSSLEAIDTVQVLITVKDSLGAGMPDIDVNTSITPSIGYVSQPDSTDSLGTTSAMYISEPGIFNNVWINVIAKNVTDSALLVITSASSIIGRIVVSPHEDEQVVDGNDSTSINITVTDSSGNPVIDGTVVYLSQTGEGILWMPELITVNGQARGKIDGFSIISPAFRIDSVFVRNFPGDSASVADTMIIHYLAGPVAHLDFVYPESTVTIIAGSGDTCSVWALATDIYGNLVEDGTQISFRNYILTSTLNPQSIITVSGLASSIYLVGSGTGNDYVTAWAMNPANFADTIWTVHPVEFRCIGPGSDSARLVLSISNDRIEVGGYSTNIIATILDAYFNPIFDGELVAFDMMDSSGGPSFDSLSQVQHDTVQTNINSQAIVRLFSGHKSGIITIRACTVPRVPDSLHVCDERPLVTITPGPPENIVFGFSSIGQADPPARFVLVAADVDDRFSNPVQYGTAVYFRLTPYDIANIEGNSYTGGGRPYYPDSTEGVAYTRIVYSPPATFHNVQVIASTAGEFNEIVDTSAAYSLPIYQGEIGMVANPGNLYTADSTCDSRDTSWVTVTLIDGGGNRIEDGIISFTAPIVGSIIGQTMDTTDTDGHARAMFMIRGCDIPCQDNQCTIDASVRATLQQKPSVWSIITITCSRPIQ